LIAAVPAKRRLPPEYGPGEPGSTSSPTFVPALEDVPFGAEDFQGDGVEDQGYTCDSF